MQECECEISSDIRRCCRPVHYIQFQTVPNNDLAICHIEEIGFVLNLATLFWQHNEDHGNGLVQYQLDNKNQDSAMGTRRQKRPDWQQALKQIHQKKQRRSDAEGDGGVVITRISIVVERR